MKTRSLLSLLGIPLIFISSCIYNPSQEERAREMMRERQKQEQQERSLPIYKARTINIAYQNP